MSDVIRLYIKSKYIRNPNKWGIVEEGDVYYIVINTSDSTLRKKLYKIGRRCEFVKGMKIIHQKYLYTLVEYLCKRGWEIKAAGDKYVWLTRDISYTEYSSSSEDSS